MAGADGGPGTGPEWRWDVALSFAGAQRDYVEQVAEELKARGVRCFYDASEQIGLWGTYLTEELPAVYGERAAAVVVFVSAEYAARDWTRLERRASLNRAVRERREYVLPARFDDTPLPGLLSDMVAVDLRGRIPQQFAAMVIDKLAALGIVPPASSAHVKGPAGGVVAARPGGAVRVDETDPQRLGVHAAITAPGVPEETSPEYVPRDVDTAEFGVRARVAAAAGRGGFVLLVGGSSVGKTRCAFEAVRALLPDWWLVHPAGPAEVAARAAAPSPRMVVWLDELQRYLDGEHGLTGGVVRALLNAEHPAVLIGTLWPDRYTAYTTVPIPGGADPHAREREVLELAAVIRIDPVFSPAEQDRARDAATRDQRLAIALETAGYGPTQTLAAAPQLVARWQDAQTASPYAWAVLTAALDAARLGARAPLSADFLQAAAPGYCTSRQLAEASANWFEEARDYATSKLYGAVAALSPVGSRIGQVDGYTEADYLIQHAIRERRFARVPASTWDAVLSHIGDPGDSARLADSASNRLLYGYAIPLYRHAANAGDRRAASRLAGLLEKRGNLDEAIEILRAQVDADDLPSRLADLADLLEKRGDLDEAEQVLRTRADRDLYARRHLAELLYERGDLDRAMQVLGARAGEASWLLADALAGLGLDELRALVAAHLDDAEWLAHLLAGRGDLDGLRALAAAGDGYAAVCLAGLLEKRGDLDELRARADAGDPFAASRLAHLLKKRGDLDEAIQALRAQADAGDQNAAIWLAELLEERGDLDEAEQVLRGRADAGGRFAAMRLAVLLERRGDLDELRARADAGDVSAASRLAWLLLERGDLDELRAWADAGDVSAGLALAGLLEKRGDLDELRARADAGDRQAADLLEKRSDQDEAIQVLRTRADAGEVSAALALAELLEKRGDLDDAEQVLRHRAGAGDQNAAIWLAELLEKRGDLDKVEQVLRAWTDAGDSNAAVQLTDLLTKQGRAEEADRLRRFGLNPDGSIASA